MGYSPPGGAPDPEEERAHARTGIDVFCSGFMNFQTTSLPGVTSKTVPPRLSQMSVSPLERRFAPDMRESKKSSFRGEE